MKSVYFFVIFLLLANCKPPPPQIETAFYHWKTSVKIEKGVQERLKKLSCSKIYLRVFDIDFEQENNFPQPIGELLKPRDSLTRIFLQTQKIIPTVFITNRTFLKLRKNQIDTLVFLTKEKIEAVTEGGEWKTEMWQFDCDWTSETREKYFLFLKKMQSLSKQKITATLRLHQVKFFEREGVPPIERGTLMAYNVGDLSNLEGNNSILSMKDLNNFLPKNKRYPLTIDVALPIFSWGVVLRDGQAVLLIHGLEEIDFLDPSVSSSFTKKNYGNTLVFECKHNVYFKNHYMYRNDEIRLERVSPKSLQDCAEALARKLPYNPNLTLTFYHLDSIHLQRYSDETFKNIKNIFQYPH